MLTTHPQVAEALDAARVGFLTAVNASGQPQTTPVWYLREGEDLIVYNQPTTPRLRSITANPQVSFALRGDPNADGILSLEGRAEIDAGLPPVDQYPAYVAKYADAIARLGFDPEQFAQAYSVGIRITVTRVRASRVEHVLAAEQ